VNLREAMPFDRIGVTLHLQAVYERGVCFQFEYFRIDSKGERVKLATGEHVAAWMVRKANIFEPALLPPEFQKALFVYKFSGQ
jgi:acyl-CoA thioesterase FadM